MKAAIIEKYGDPDIFEIKDMEKPTPRENEVLIRVRASSINSHEWRSLRAIPLLVRFKNGIFKPKNPILGCDVAGEIEAVGKNIKTLEIGDKVYGCLADGNGDSCYAEYVCAKESIITKIPQGFSLPEMGAVPMAAVTALQGLRNLAKLQSGQKILINGASGGVGTFAVQIAKAMGAQVTGVCSSKNIDLIKMLGADVVIDYKKRDFTNLTEKYDVIFDIIANHSFSDYKRVLKPNGIYVVVGFSTMKNMVRTSFDVSRTKNKNQKVVMLMADNTVQQDLCYMNTLLESKKVVPVIDNYYPLSKISEAFWYYEKEHPKGKVVIEI